MMTLTSTGLPVASPRASASRSRWSSLSGDGGAHLGHRLVGLGRAHLDQLVDDGRQVAGAAGADHERHEGDGGRRRLAAEQVLHDLLRRATGMPASVSALAQLVGPLEGLREAEQLVLDLVEGALGPGHLEQGLGVGGVRSSAIVVALRRGAAPPTWLM